jgi:hypothetical protein
LLQNLRVSPETYPAFKAGFSATGVNRGRLSLPVDDRDGAVVCYCGRALEDESPKLLFPNGTDPHGHIFNAHQVRAGELYLVRDPLQVLTAYEAGETNVVAFLTDGITAQQRELLAWTNVRSRACSSIDRHPCHRRFQNGKRHFCCYRRFEECRVRMKGRAQEKSEDEFDG